MGPSPGKTVTKTLKPSREKDDKKRQKKKLETISKQKFGHFLAKNQVSVLKWFGKNKKPKKYQMATP